MQILIKKQLQRYMKGGMDNIKCIFILPPYFNLVLSNKNFISWPLLIFKVNLFPKLYWVKNGIITFDRLLI